MASKKAEVTPEVKAAQEVIAKARAAEKGQKDKAVIAAAEAQAQAIPVMVAETEVVYHRSSDLIPWAKNPRKVLPDPVADDILKASLASGWDVRYPAVIFPDRSIIQGNRRHGMVSPDTMVPCVVYEGDEAGALLLALQDTGTGIQRKGDGDIARTAIVLMREYGLSAHTLASYLWTRGREILFSLSPTAQRAKTVEEAQRASRGRLQNVERIGRLPASIQDRIFAEQNDATRKNKVFSGATIADLLKAKNPSEMDTIIEARRDELAAQESGEADPKAPNRLTGKHMSDRKLSFNSVLFRNLAALFDRAEDQERNALQLLAELDASAAMRE